MSLIVREGCDRSQASAVQSPKAGCARPAYRHGISRTLILETVETALQIPRRTSIAKAPCPGAGNITSVGSSKRGKSMHLQSSIPAAAKIIASYYRRLHLFQPGLHVSTNRQYSRSGL